MPRRGADFIKAAAKAIFATGMGSADSITEVSAGGESPPTGTPDGRDLATVKADVAYDNSVAQDAEGYVDNVAPAAALRRIRLIERLKSKPALANQHRRNYIRAKLAKHF